MLDLSGVSRKTPLHSQGESIINTLDAQLASQREGQYPLFLNSQQLIYLDFAQSNGHLLWRE